MRAFEEQYGLSLTTLLDPAARDNNFRIVRGNAGGGDWSPVLANGFLPALSRDGKWIAFAASGPPARKLPTSRAPVVADDGCALRVLFACIVARA